jgi:hypothetical protein
MSYASCTSAKRSLELLARPNVSSFERERATATIISESTRMARLVEDLVDTPEKARRGFSL